MKMSIQKLLKWKFSITSFFSVLVISLNLAFIGSTIIGSCASMVYIITNGYLLGNVFFRKEKVIFKVPLGALLLLTLLGLIGAPFAIFYKLGLVEVSTLLFTGCILTLLGTRIRPGTHRQQDETENDR